MFEGSEVQGSEVQGSRVQRFRVQGTKVQGSGFCTLTGDLKKGMSAYSKTNDI